MFFVPLIKPFRALRPQKFTATVAELPYDVVSREEAKTIARNKPYSFFHISRAEIDLPENISPYDSVVYEKAKFNLDKFIEDGILKYDEKESYYIYQQEFQGRRQSGVVALVSAQDYENGLIKKHELTRRDKEDDRVKHIESCGAQTGLVFLAYNAKSEAASARSIVSNLIKVKPEVEFTSEDSVTHRLWCVNSNDDVNKITSAFQAMKTFYIADGHHRAQAAWRVSQASKSPAAKYFLATIFCSEELFILPYYRLIKCSFPAEEVIRKISALESFECREISLEQGLQNPPRHRFNLFLAGKWFELAAKPQIIQESDAIKSLDAFIVQEFLLKPIFAIQDPRSDKNIDFMGGIHGPQGVQKFCESHPQYIGITIAATKMDEIIRVADQDKIMPPKSTWFEPKLRSGIVINKF